MTPHRRALLPVLLLTFLIPSTPVAIEVMPFDQVATGMKGTGRTVFSGSTVETFDFEVIATMKNILPKKNLIVARLRGGPLADSGVMEGMSGSPVYIEGKIVGAVSYAWGFATEPICGITPIEEMLDMLDRPVTAEAGRGAPLSPPAQRTAGSADVALLAWPEKITGFLQAQQRRLRNPGAGLMTGDGATSLGVPGFLRPIRPTLAFSGFNPAIVESWFPVFESMSLRPVMSGAIAAAPARAEGNGVLEPGSAFGASLVRGDLDITAIGTVTHTVGDKLVGLGHPFLGMGPTALPMTAAHVHGYMPSLSYSFKLASPSQVVGAITQDRFSGVAGVTGQKVDMVPIRVELHRPDGETTTYRFDIVPDPLLMPGLLNLSLLNLLAGDEKLVGDISLRLTEGSRIQVSGDLDVKLDNMFSGEYAPYYASATVAYMTYLLLNNDDRDAAIEGINLLMEYEDRRRVARIERVWLERYTVRPGETLPIHVEIRPFRGERQVVAIPLEIPPEAEEGKALLQVGDSLTLSRMESVGGAAPFFPRSLEHMVWLLNHIRSNQNVYATVIRPDIGAIIAGERLPNLPPSVASVLLGPDLEPNNTSRVRIRAILEASTETAHVIRGYQKTMLEIRR